MFAKSWKNEKWCVDNVLFVEWRCKDNNKKKLRICYNQRDFCEKHCFIDTHNTMNVQNINT
jgi:hypothetical protein